MSVCVRFVTSLRPVMRYARRSSDITRCSAIGLLPQRASPATAGNSNPCRAGTASHRSLIPPSKSLGKAYSAIGAISAEPRPDDHSGNGLSRSVSGNSGASSGTFPACRRRGARPRRSPRPARSGLSARLRPSSYQDFGLSSDGNPGGASDTHGRSTPSRDPQAQQVHGGRLRRALPLGVHAQQHGAVRAEHDAGRRWAARRWRSTRSTNTSIPTWDTCRCSGGPGAAGRCWRWWACRATSSIAPWTWRRMPGGTGAWRSSAAPTR